MDEQRRQAAWDAEDQSEESAREGSRIDVGTSADASSAGLAETQPGMRNEGGTSPTPRTEQRESMGHTGIRGSSHDDLRSSTLEGGMSESSPEPVERGGPDDRPPGFPVQAQGEDVEGSADKGGDRKRLASQVDPL